jgi:opacity protein-like surface antigen
MRNTSFGCIATALAAVLCAAEARADLFVDIGVHGTHVEADVATFTRTTTSESGVHLGVGLRRELANGSIGARLELDDIDGNALLAVRALDYRRHLTQRFAVTAFLGAARLDLATPAYGYYLGTGVELKDLWPNWSVGLDLRYGDKIARDNLLPSDPQGGKNDNFYDLSGISLYLSRRF